MKDYIQFDGMPVVLFMAILVSKLQYMLLGDWIAQCICNAGRKWGRVGKMKRKREIFPLLSNKYGAANTKT